MALAFTELGLLRVGAQTLNRNVASARTRERAGFVFEGRRRGALRDAHGQLDDEVC